MIWNQTRKLKCLAWVRITRNGQGIVIWPQSPCSYYDTLGHFLTGHLSLAGIPHDWMDPGSPAATSTALGRKGCSLNFHIGWLNSPSAMEYQARLEAARLKRKSHHKRNGLSRPSSFSATKLHSVYSDGGRLLEARMYVAGEVVCGPLMSRAPQEHPAKTGRAASGCASK